MESLKVVEYKNEQGADITSSAENVQHVWEAKK